MSAPIVERAQRFRCNCTMTCSCQLSRQRRKMPVNFSISRMSDAQPREKLLSTTARHAINAWRWLLTSNLRRDPSAAALRTVRRFHSLKHLSAVLWRRHTQMSGHTEAGCAGARRRLVTTCACTASTPLSLPSPRHIFAVRTAWSRGFSAAREARWGYLYGSAMIVAPTDDACPRPWILGSASRHPRRPTEKDGAAGKGDAAGAPERGHSRLVATGPLACMLSTNGPLCRRSTPCAHQK